MRISGSPTKILGSRWKHWGLGENSGVSHESIRDSDEIIFACNDYIRVVAENIMISDEKIGVSDENTRDSSYYGLLLNKIIPINSLVF